jgi:hypothetical protein
MRLTNALLLSACLALSASGALAAKRGNSAGDWQRGECTEPQFASRFGFGTSDYATNKVTADTSEKHTGQASIRLDTTSTADTWLCFPNTKDLDLDATQLTAFKFSLRSENKIGWGGDPGVVFRDISGKAAKFKGTKQRLIEALKGWADLTIPLGTSAIQTAAAETDKYLKTDEKTRGAAPVEWLLTVEPGFDWQHIASLEIHTPGGRTVWHDGMEFVGAEPARWWLSSLDKPDLSVTWAEQCPRYPRYAVDYPHMYPELSLDEQTKKHRPEKGEAICYEVHVKNVGFRRSEATDFVCTIDRKTALRTEVPALDPRKEIVVKVTWNWEQGAYPWEARVDTASKLDEISKKNNALTFQTDAYTLQAICEKGMTEGLDAVNSSLGSFSFEDWLRGQTVDTMNALFRRCKYDFAPQGAKIGVRIGRIVVVDKIAEDTAGNLPVWLACDGSWSYPTGSVPEYTSLANSFIWALNHELTHQLGIIDDYQLNFGGMHGESNKINGKMFTQPDGGMMGGGHIGDNAPPAYADMDIAAMNLTYGCRRGFFGEYLYCIPDKNTLVLAVEGQPLANAEVEVYQKDMRTGLIEGAPTQKGTTDGAGRFELMNRPWYPIEGATAEQTPDKAPGERLTTATGCVLKPNPFGYIDAAGANGLLMVRAKSGGEYYHEFIDVGHFVCEYARGHRESATYVLKMNAE